MDNIHIDEMTAAVLEALGLPESKREAVSAALRSQWDGKVALVWTRADIASICDRNFWKRPSLEDCDTLLDSLLLETNGVTTETIEARIKDSGLAVSE